MLTVYMLNEPKIKLIDDYIKQVFKRNHDDKKYLLQLDVLVGRRFEPERLEQLFDDEGLSGVADYMNFGNKMLDRRLIEKCFTLVQKDVNVGGRVRESETSNAVVNTKIHDCKESRNGNEVLHEKDHFLKLFILWCNAIYQAQEDANIPMGQGIIMEQCIELLWPCICNTSDAFRVPNVTREDKLYFLFTEEIRENSKKVSIIGKKKRDLTPDIPCLEGVSRVKICPGLKPSYMDTVVRVFNLGSPENRGSEVTQKLYSGAWPLTVIFEGAKVNKTCTIIPVANLNEKLLNTMNKIAEQDDNTTHNSNISKIFKGYDADGSTIALYFQCESKTKQNKRILNSVYSYSNDNAFDDYNSHWNKSDYCLPGKINFPKNFAKAKNFNLLLFLNLSEDKIKKLSECLEENWKMMPACEFALYDYGRVDIYVKPHFLDN